MSDYPYREPERTPQEQQRGLDLLFVKTIAGPGVTAYPPEGDNPTVYYCQFLAGVTYPLTVGAQVLSYTALQRFGFVFNLCDGAYIEVNSVIGVFPKNNRYWTMDKLRQMEFLTVCHSHAATTHSTGSVSRLDPETGAVIWTTSLGIDVASGLIRSAYRVALDSRGNTYALWMLQDPLEPAGWMHDIHPAGKTVGGVAKIDRLGNLDNILTLGDLHPSIDPFANFESDDHWQGRVVVDPNDNDRIYFSCRMDSAGYWLYRVDADLTVTWGIGPSATPSDVLYNCYGTVPGLAVDNNGDLYITPRTGKTIPAMGSPRIIKIAAANGAASVYAITDQYQTCVLVDPINNKPRTGTSFVTTLDPVYKILNGWSTPLNNFALDWSASLTNFSLPVDPFESVVSSPAWLTFTNRKTKFSAGVCDGLRLLWTNSEPFSWRINVGDGMVGFQNVDLKPSLFCTDRDGVAVYCVYLTERPTTVANFKAWSWSVERAYDISIDAAAGGTYAAGVAKSLSGWPTAFKLDTSNGTVLWRANMFPASTGTQTGFGVAARTIRG